MIVEICCGNLASVLAAKAGGATRIELCSGLSEGGLTPSCGLIKAAVEAGIPEVNVLIRPRSGDFLYSEEEINMMVEDVKNAIGIGASGIVIGVLTADGDVDVAACRRLMEAAEFAASANHRAKPQVTFHRAFDVSRDARASLEDVIGMGVDCLLTSGMAPSAVKGIPMLKNLVDLSGGRVRIMAGAGINPSNAADIVEATGVEAIHSTARKPIPSRMRFRRPLVPMGAPGSDEYAPLSTSADVVEKLCAIRPVERL